MPTSLRMHKRTDIAALQDADQVLRVVEAENAHHGQPLLRVLEGSDIGTFVHP